MMTYKTHGVCSRAITFDVDGNKLTNVQFAGGCSGNTQGGPRPTSCPDQLAQALKEYKAQLA